MYSESEYLDLKDLILSAPATFTLVAVNIAVYIVLYLLFPGWFFSLQQEAIVLFGQANSLVFSGWLYQLITAMFVHFHIIHLLSNLVFLIIFGLRLEELHSSRSVLLVYILAGLGGNLLSLIGGPLLLSAGASGAIFGIFGANLMILRDLYREGTKTAIIIALFYFFITIGVNTNVLAHFGGLIVGLAMGYLFSRNIRDQQRKRRSRGYR
ncbi:MAG: rhomboid family intramembrane serine protease [Candidatus Hermodarchaeota archaeon]